MRRGTIRIPRTRSNQITARDRPCTAPGSPHSDPAHPRSSPRSREKSPATPPSPQRQPIATRRCRRPGGDPGSARPRRRRGSRSPQVRVSPARQAARHRASLAPLDAWMCLKGFRDAANAAARVAGAPRPAKRSSGGQAAPAPAMPAAQDADGNGADHGERRDASEASWTGFAARRACLGSRSGQRCKRSGMRRAL